MNEMTGLLLPATFIAWTLAVQHIRSRAMPTSLRMSAMVAVVLLSATLTAATELLSLFHAISFWPILLFWLAALGAALPLAAKAWPQTDVRLQRINPRSRLEWILCALVLLILAATFLVSRFYPPQTFDTLSYHLPRQVMWWQQASLDNFDSSKYRNLSMPPFSEFIGLHLFVLTGGSDLWHTSIQWAFLVVGLCGVSLLVRTLGGTRSAQWLAALFVVAFPAIYYEATSAKNDIIVGVFLVTLFVLVARSRSISRHYGTALLVGLALGLALLTKGTSYILAAPVMVWLVWRMWRSCRFHMLGRIVMILLIAATLNAGYWARNVAIFGRPLGPPEGADPGVIIANQSHAPLKVLSVLTRNVAMLSLTPFEPVNARMFEAVAAIHHAFGISLADPDTSFRSPFHLPTDWFYLEECITSPLHNILILAGLSAAFLTVRRRPMAAIIGLCIITGFVLFSAYLTWQEFHIRLLLPLIFPAAAVVSVALPSRGRRHVVAYAITVICLLAGIAPTQILSPRPLLARETWTKSRQALRVGNAKEIITTSAISMAEVLAKIPNVHTVGIFESTTDNLTYVIMRPVLDTCGPNIRFQFVHPAVRVSPHAAIPDVIISDNSEPFVQINPSVPSFAAVKLIPPYALCFPRNMPDLSRVTTVIRGELIEVIPTDQNGIAAGLIRVDSVLRGPPDLKQVYITVFTNQYLKSSNQMLARFYIGNQGIWLLRPSGIGGLMLAPNAQYLLQDSQLPEIQKLLKPLHD